MDRVPNVYRITDENGDEWCVLADSYAEAEAKFYTKMSEDLGGIGDEIGPPQHLTLLYQSNSVIR